MVLTPVPSKSPESAPLRVMVVDDSLVLRGLISRMVNEAPAIAQVVATAQNGQVAIDRARQGNLDVVILDIEMPVMDGITALPELLAIDRNLVVIMASTLTTRNAEISLKAISAGAKDYVPKPSSLTPGAGAEDFKRELLEKIKTLGHRYRRRSVAPAQSGGELSPGSKATLFSLRPVTLGRPSALAIACSTGGPNALQQLLKAMPGPLRVPVFVTQHMPPTFTALLATNLSRETSHRCAEAQNGEVVRAGCVYIAPGDYHMTVVRKGSDLVIKLDQLEKENFCRPAADPMLRSLSAIYNRQLLVAILTGMGQDGLSGGKMVVESGGNLLAQDEASSVVWGMPGAVARAGLACAVLPIPQLATRLCDMVGR